MRHYVNLIEVAKIAWDSFLTMVSQLRRAASSGSDIKATRTRPVIGRPTKPKPQTISYIRKGTIVVFS